jgi:hypothetical protein
MMFFGFYCLMAAGAMTVASVSLQRRSWKPSIRFHNYCAKIRFAPIELLQLHEVIGIILETELGLSDIFRNWNDAVVMVYGVNALFVIAGFAPEIIRYRGVAEKMVIAFVFYLTHTLIDALADPETPLSMIVEDAMKLFASSYLALCMLVAMLGMISADPIPRNLE